ncbi:MAG: ligase-associated DNA damage response endonuclease PdeM [Hyphomicrobiaceae bacterium]
MHAGAERALRQRDASIETDIQKDIGTDAFGLEIARQHGGTIINVCGRQLVGDRSGAIYWPSHSALVVSDLHLEKGSAAAARGRMMPPYDTRETLLRLAEIVDRFDPRTVISLGDSFHDTGAGARMHPEDRAILAEIQRDRIWVWVTGNHDPEVPDWAGGTIVDAIAVGGLTFRHEPMDGPASHEIAGHLHPVARLALHGACLRRGCFVGDGRRLVMPAFGAFTGGLNVLDGTIASLFSEQPMLVWIRGAEALYPVSLRHLRPD